MAAVLPMGTSKPVPVPACSCMDGECEVARRYDYDDGYQARCGRYIARSEPVVVKICKHCPSSNAEVKVACHGQNGVCLSKVDCEREALLKRRRY